MFPFFILVFFTAAIGTSLVLSGQASDVALLSDRGESLAGMMRAQHSAGLSWFHDQMSTNATFRNTVINLGSGQQSTATAGPLVLGRYAPAPGILTIVEYRNPGTGPEARIITYYDDATQPILARAMTASLGESTDFYAGAGMIGSDTDGDGRREVVTRKEAVNFNSYRRAFSVPNAIPAMAPVIVTKTY